MDFEIGDVERDGDGDVKVDPKVDVRVAAAAAQNQAGELNT
jgi:hypothetical protein